MLAQLKLVGIAGVEAGVERDAALGVEEMRENLDDLDRAGAGGGGSRQQGGEQEQDIQGTHARHSSEPAGQKTTVMLGAERRIASAKNIVRPVPTRAMSGPSPAASRPSAVPWR